MQTNLQLDLTPTTQPVISQQFPGYYAFSANGSPNKGLAKKLVTELTSCGCGVYRDGECVLIPVNGHTVDIGLISEAGSALAHEVVQGISTNARSQVADDLQGYRLMYITKPDVAKSVVNTLIEDANQSGCLALDTETQVLAQFRQPVPVKTNKDGSISARQPKSGVAGYALQPQRASVRLLQAYAGGETVAVFDMNHLDWSVVAPLTHEAPQLALFNSLFDLQMMIASGCPEPTAPIFDTQLAMRLVDGGTPAYSRGADSETSMISLAETYERLFGRPIVKGLGASDWGVASLSDDQLVYAALDGVYTHQIWAEQVRLLSQTDSEWERVTDHVGECLVPTARMMLAGLPVDEECYRDLITHWESEYTEACIRLAEATNNAITQDSLNKAAVVGAYIEQQCPDHLVGNLKRTPRGAVAADKEQQMQFIGVIPGMDQLATCKTWAKALSTYGHSLLDKVIDGRMYGRFNLCGAKSGRFSSSEPNLQNLPKRGQRMAGYRRVFAPKVGRCLLVADYSQVEVRVAASLSGDSMMTSNYRLFGELRKQPALQRRYDVHTQSAMGMVDNYDALPPEEQGEVRSKAKATTFSVLFGGSAKGIASYAKTTYGMDLPHHEAQSLLDDFRAKYPELAAWMDNTQAASKESGYVETVMGRRWHFEWESPDPNKAGVQEALWAMDDYEAERFLSGYRPTLALNFPVQGTAAEIMQRAIIRIDKSLRGLDAQLLASVHDEVIVELGDDPNLIAAVHFKVTAAMMRAFREVLPGAPYRACVDVGISQNWAEGH